MKRNMLVVSLGLGVLLTAFQNCSPASFGTNSASSSSKATQTLVPLSDGDTDTTAGVPDSNSGTTSTPPATTPPNTLPPTVGNGNGNSNNNTTTTLTTPPPVPPTAGQTSDSDEDYVACILNSHGKSLKLGLLTEKLGGVYSVAESVCVTSHECLGDIANAFSVEGAYDRGYCDNNPNVKRLTDDQVKALLGVQ
jgi:hypothetical protein